MSLSDLLHQFLRWHFQFLSCHRFKSTTPIDSDPQSAVRATATKAVFKLQSSFPPVFPSFAAATHSTFSIAVRIGPNFRW